RAAALENLRVTSATMDFLVPQTDQARRRSVQTLDRALADPSAWARIDSGKLAQPYWYTQSPLTTPGPSLAGFPAKPCAVRPPVRGVICPDGPCVADGSATRLRRLFGRSFVLLTARPTAADAARKAAAPATDAPVHAYALEEIDARDVL